MKRSVTLLMFSSELDLLQWKQEKAVDFKAIVFHKVSTLVDFYIAEKPVYEKVFFLTSEDTEIKSGLRALGFLIDGLIDC